MQRDTAPVLDSNARTAACAVGFFPAAAACLLSIATAGCDAGSPGAPPGLDLLGFLSPRRVRAKDFGGSLDNMAPVRAGEDIREPAPFVERRSGPGRRSTAHILWPFLSVSTSRAERSFAFRPIVAGESRPGEKRVEALWPVFSYYREREDKTFLIRPLFFFKHRVRTEGSGREYDTDWFLVVPPMAGGRDTREGAYFAIFPLFGTVKGQLGKEKISFFAWPLWMAARDKRYESFHFMWPFIGYWKGPEQCGRRLWPFFGADHREGRFDRRYWLWPFFSRWQTGLDTKYPGEARFFFPFYGRIRNERILDSGERVPNLDWWTFLWPLYSFRTDARRNLTESHVPWPVFGHERADGLVVRKLWPVWGVRKSNDRRDKFVLWPLYRRTLVHQETHEERWHSLGFLMVTRLERWVVDEKGNVRPPPWPEDFGRIPDPRIEAGTHRPIPSLVGEVRSRRYTLLWPLFQYKRNEHGEVGFRFPSIFSYSPTGGRAETLWGPFFSVYRYERDRTMQKRESLLFGLFRHFRRPEDPGPGMRYVNLAGLASYHRRSGIGKRFSILGGLVGYERVGGRRAWKFLWVWFGRIPREVREEYEARQAAASGHDRRPDRAAALERRKAALE